MWSICQIPHQQPPLHHQIIETMWSGVNHISNMTASHSLHRADKSSFRSDVNKSSISGLFISSDMVFSGDKLKICFHQISIQCIDGWDLKDLSVCSFLFLAQVCNVCKSLQSCWYQYQTDFRLIFSRLFICLHIPEDLRLTRATIWTSACARGGFILMPGIKGLSAYPHTCLEEPLDQETPQCHVL